MIRLRKATKLPQNFKNLSITTVNFRTLDRDKIILPEHAKTLRVYVIFKLSDANLSNCEEYFRNIQ